MLIKLFDKGLDYRVCMFSSVSHKWNFVPKALYGFMDRQRFQSIVEIEELRAEFLRATVQHPHCDFRAALFR